MEDKGWGAGQAGGSCVGHPLSTRGIPAEWTPDVPASDKAPTTAPPPPDSSKKEGPGSSPAPHHSHVHKEAGEHVASVAEHHLDVDVARLLGDRVHVAGLAQVDAHLGKARRQDMAVADGRTAGSEGGWRQGMEPGRQGGHGSIAGSARLAKGRSGSVPIASAVPF